MPVFLPTSIIGNARNLVTLGHSGELMGWFYPHKDADQHITTCLPCAYIGDGGRGKLSYFFEQDWSREQRYLLDSNVLQTTLEGFGLRVTLTDVMPDDADVLYRQIRVENVSSERCNGGFYHYGHWKIGGHHQGNGLVFHHAERVLTQSQRAASLAVGGDALESWHCGKAGENWAHNARYALGTRRFRLPATRNRRRELGVRLLRRLAGGRKRRTNRDFRARARSRRGHRSAANSPTRAISIRF